MAEISVRELKSRLSAHLRRIERGESITVTRRGRPIAVISPAPGLAADEEQRLRRKLEELKARGILVNVPAGKPKGLDEPVTLRGKGPLISEMVLEDRGDPLP